MPELLYWPRLAPAATQWLACDLSRIDTASKDALVSDLHDVGCC
jgi:hypothetical protein